MPARGIRVKVRVRSAPRTFLFPFFSRATPSSSTSLMTTTTTTTILERRIFRLQILDRQSRHLPDGNHRKRPTSGLRRSWAPPPFFFPSSPRTPTPPRQKEGTGAPGSFWIRALYRNSYPFFVSRSFHLSPLYTIAAVPHRPFRHVSSRLLSFSHSFAFLLASGRLSTSRTATVRRGH